MPTLDVPPPTKEKRESSVCVSVHMCVCECLAKRLVAGVFSGCFRAGSANAACVLACALSECVRSSSVVGHDSKEGVRTHGSELDRRPKGQIQLSTVLLPLSFSL